MRVLIVPYRRKTKHSTDSKKCVHDDNLVLYTTGHFFLTESDTGGCIVDVQLLVTEAQCKLFPKTENFHFTLFLRFNVTRCEFCLRMSLAKDI